MMLDVGRIGAAVLAGLVSACSSLFPFEPREEDEEPDAGCDVTGCDGGLVCAQGQCVAPETDEDGDGYPVESDCDDRDPDVVPGSMRPCSSECADGIETCEDGEWQSCTAPEECTCVAGETRGDPCGNCGTSRRTCEADGSWGPAGDCTGEGQCSSGAEEDRACGDGPCQHQSRSCDGNCRWDAWGQCVDARECSPGQTEQTPCGNCGQATRTCTDECVWGPEGVCEDQGVCEAASTESETCSQCGGTRARVCSALCDWPPFGGPCSDDGCAPDQDRSCERGCGTDICTPECRWAGCDATCHCDDRGAVICPDSFGCVNADADCTSGHNVACSPDCQMSDAGCC